MAIEEQDTRIEATRKHFDLQAKEYDLEHRARPHYSEMQQVVARAIPFSFEASFSVLELGVGTALLTEKILQRFPSVKLDGLELSPEMITQARARLAPFGDRVKLARIDFALELPSTQYHVVCSSLALHHLPRTNRDRFYARLAECILPGGALIVADRVMSPTKELGERYKKMRTRELLDLGWTQEDFARERNQRQNRGRLEGTDHGPSSVGELLRFFREAGLTNVDCIWKQGTEAVLYGEKRS